MNKKILSIAALLSVISCAVLQARTHEYRSPLSVQRGVMHYPLPSPGEAWWLDNMKTERNNDSKWDVHAWGSFYMRCANQAYFDECDNSNTRQRRSLSTLFFGKESFRGEETFPGGFIDTTDDDNLKLIQKNIFLGFARISPRFSYYEDGAVFGLHTERKLGSDDQWRVGGRISLPFKKIRVEQDNTCKIEETLDDVVQSNILNRNVSSNANTNDFAVRLDFLSVLNNQFISLPPVVGFVPEPFVVYGTGADALNETRMAGNNRVTGANAADANARVYAIRRTDSSMPCPDFLRNPTQVSGSIAADGSGGSNDSVLFFREGTNYLGAAGGNALARNRDAQSQLFVVGRAFTNDNFALSADSAAVRQNLTNILVGINSFGERETATEFFRDRCIDLCKNEMFAALGDLFTEFYAGYGHDVDWFVNGLIGVRFPTGTKAETSNRLYFQSTGHNRHWEVKLGVEGGWQPFDWFGFKLDANYNHAFKRTEKVAAPFRGATVKNIGPEIDADVSWHYFTGHVDFTFFHPHNPEMGAVFGYELFAKLEDNISLCSTMAVPLGITNPDNDDLSPLDACVLEKRSDVMSHKIRGEIFHRWNFWHVFAGASHVVAGKNAMRETEAHVGVAMHF